MLTNQKKLKVCYHRFFSNYFVKLCLFFFEKDPITVATYNIILVLTVLLLVTRWRCKEVGNGGVSFILFPFTDGQFAAYMQVSIQNDGPVTFEIESPANLPSKERRTNNGTKQVSNETDNQVEDNVDKV